MTTQEILSVLSTIHNGSFFPVVFETDLANKISANARKNGFTVVKRTNAVVRKGITYDNMKSVKEKRESGELPEENAGLPWGAWKIFNLIIEHKGTDYLRLYTSQENKPDSVYIVNGAKYTYNELRDLGIMQNSYFNAKKNTAEDCFTIKCNGVISIG